MKTRPSKVRHPAVSIALFLGICALGYVAWMNRDWLHSERTEELLTIHQKEVLQEKILEELDDEACFHSLRGLLNWRPNEQRYLLDIEIEDGHACEENAKALCEHVAALIDQEAHVVATVIAYDRAGREVARTVR